MEKNDSKDKDVDLDVEFTILPYLISIFMMLFVSGSLGSVFFIFCILFLH